MLYWAELEDDVRDEVGLEDDEDVFVDEDFSSLTAGFFAVATGSVLTFFAGGTSSFSFFFCALEMASAETWALRFRISSINGLSSSLSLADIVYMYGRWSGKSSKQELNSDECERRLHSFMYGSKWVNCWSCQLKRIDQVESGPKKDTFPGKNWKLALNNWKTDFHFRVDLIKSRCRHGHRSNNVGRRGSLECDKTRGSAIFVWISQWS